MPNIFFEFTGGPNDGMVYRGIVGDGSDAERYYVLSHHGTIGQRFKVASPYAIETLAREQLDEDNLHYFRQHFYVVTERLDEGGQVWICAQYL